MYYFYVLKSLKDESYYFGSADNLKRRIKEHENKKVYSTKFKQPIRLVYYEAYTSLKSVHMREKQVKNSGSIRKAIKQRLL
jgi:putative endonuclease